MKPKTSRYANSEKYVICKDFNVNKNENNITNLIHKFHENFHNLISDFNIESFLDLNMTAYI